MQSRFYLMSTALVLNVLLASTPFASSAEPAKKKDPIHDAIKKGSHYLIEAHKPDDRYSGGSNGLGTACLAGLALLESNVDEKNPSLQNIIKFVRAGCLKDNTTYNVSLCIMFLDRLGHSQDEPLIQFLGVRLLGGQLEDGGWSYDCAGYDLSVQQEARLHKAGTTEAKLVKSGPREPTKDGPAPKDKPKNDDGAQGGSSKMHPEVGKIVSEIREQNPRRKGGELQPKFGPKKGFIGMGMGFGRSDNSNTQFATLGIWCARKHGVTIERATAALEERFRTSQLDDGGWSYMGGVFTTPAMTCAGLIGLAVSFGSNDAVLKNKPDAAGPAPEKGKKPALGDDPAVKRGLKKLGESITDAKNGIVEDRGPRMRMRGGELDHNLYFLWSLERTAVIYGLDTIGKNDWYAWGSKAIVESQLDDGSWSSMFPGGFPGDVSTPLALLFLNRANVAKDLTARITGLVRDPGISTLKSGGDLSKILPGTKTDPSKEPVAIQPKDPPAKVEPKKVDSAADFETQAAKLMEAVVHATGEEQKELIKHLRDSKGAVHTEALARAVVKLTGEAKTLAREALARRLMRMSAITLREMFRDSHEEIRRAAAAAAGLKGDKQYIPDLIDLLGDKELPVVLAAHESLKTLTTVDFGPAADAADSDRTKAILSWRSWFKTQKN
jgi:hypothetical protein